MERSVELFGVVNITDNSFSDSGQYLDPVDAINKANELFGAGASCIDIGGEATNPWSKPITADEEWTRIEPVLSAFASSSYGTISVDTRKPEIVRRVFAEIGPVIINDISGFNNPRMMEAVRDLEAQCVISHLPTKFGDDPWAAHKAKPSDLLDNEETVRRELMCAREVAINMGIKSDKIILDPGIGFGKTPSLNWRLLEFAELVPDDVAVMIGHSRKRFLSTDPETGLLLPNLTPETEKEYHTRTEVNLAAARIAIKSEAQYLRVHDVAAHKQLLAELAAETETS